jgi:hypothetical protein
LRGVDGKEGGRLRGLLVDGADVAIGRGATRAVVGKAGVVGVDGGIGGSCFDRKSFSAEEREKRKRGTGTHGSCSCSPRHNHQPQLLLPPDLPSSSKSPPSASALPPSYSSNSDPDTLPPRSANSRRSRPPASSGRCRVAVEECKHLHSLLLRPHRATGLALVPARRKKRATRSRSRCRRC